MSNEQKSGRGRVYTLAEKLRAVAQAEREGTSAAARALGAPDSTVGNWRSRVPSHRFFSDGVPRSLQRLTPRPKGGAAYFDGDLGKPLGQVPGKTCGIGHPGLSGFRRGSGGC